MQRGTMSDYAKIEKVLDRIEKDVAQVKKHIEELKATAANRYDDVPGIVGYFDGASIVSDDGTKHDVPYNYIAKSRVLYGDILKIIEINDKKVFKNIDKRERVKAEGIITKKQGEWYVLTSHGSHKLLKTACEFHNLEVNDRVSVVLPGDNVKAPFAALDKVLSQKGDDMTNKTQPDQPSNGESVNTLADSGEIDLSREVSEKPIRKKTEEKVSEKSKKSDKKSRKGELKSADKTDSNNSDSSNSGVTHILEDDDLR